MRREHKVHFFVDKRIFGRRFHFLHGSVAWELQIGTHVFQLFYENFRGKRFHYWRDSFES